MITTIEDFIPLALEAAANSLETALGGGRLDVDGVLAGSMALHTLVSNAPSPTPSLSEFADFLRDLAHGYPGSMPANNIGHLIFEGHVARLRNIKGFCDGDNKHARSGDPCHHNY